MDLRKVFTLLEAAEFVLLSKESCSAEEIGEANADTCWRFSCAFGEAMTRFLATRVTQEVLVVKGTYWVVARYRGAPWSRMSICTIGTAIARTYDHSVAICWTGRKGPPARNTGVNSGEETAGDL